MNLDESVQKHAEWKIRFRTAINNKEQLDVAAVSKDNCCEIGKWLHGAGRTQCGSLGEFKRAIDAHKEFHIEAGKIAKLINAQQYADATQAIASGSHYLEVSNKVGMAFAALKKAAKL